MAFTQAGADIAMTRNPATGKLTFDWGTDGNPKFSDDNIHRVLSLLIEHRPSPGRFGDPGSPGYIWDRTGKRGSLIYTVKNARKSTPSELEAYALDALEKAVAEGWISDPKAKAYMTPPRARLEITWRNVNGKTSSTRVAIGS